MRLISVKAIMQNSGEHLLADKTTNLIDLELEEQVAKISHQLESSARILNALIEEIQVKEITEETLMSFLTLAAKPELYMVVKAYCIAVAEEDKLSKLVITSPHGTRNVKITVHPKLKVLTC